MTELDRLTAALAVRQATVAVVGLGYVGLPVVVAAADEGFAVVGVDVDAGRIAALQGGHSYIRDVSDAAVAAIGPAAFTLDMTAVRTADVIVIAVPTPLREGRPDISAIEQAADEVTRSLRPGQLVILESTSYPGTTNDVVLAALERSGLHVEDDFALAYSPERISPGTGRRLRTIPKVVAGVGPASTQLATAFYRTLVDEVVTAPSPREAEMAKLIENTFRQVNIALVNEFATVASAIGVDLWAALEVAATKPFGYMPFWPGPGVGGHCIAIDPTYLSWKVEQRLGFGLGFVEHARAVNHRMPAYVAERVAQTLNRFGRPLSGSRLVILGVAYKGGVDDVRESAALDVFERLLIAGGAVSYHDPLVHAVSVNGQEFKSLVLSPSMMAAADCVVILTAHPGIDYYALTEAAPVVFDAVGATRHRRSPRITLL